MKCVQCGTKFYVKPYFLKRGWGKYCSKKCQHEGMRTGKEMPCHICGKITYKQEKDFRRSKSGLFFCSKSCQTRWRNQVYVGEKHGNFVTGISAYRGILGRDKVPKKCKLCKTADIRVLVVHHIDRNRRNNKVKNLVWLCHNCHFLVHHNEAEQEELIKMVPMV